MENKCVNKSTMQQLHALVLHMQENPDMARGVPFFGANRASLEDEWQKLCKNLNSLGPPPRTIVDWKKTWSDLKSRTKRKVSSNNKSLKETGGGLYRFSKLTELEEIIDRTLLLSSAAAPNGKRYDYTNEASKCLEDTMVSLLETPPRTSKSVAVVTTTNNTTAIEKETTGPETQAYLLSPQPTNNEPNLHGTRQRAFGSDRDADEPSCWSTAKKRKVASSEQMFVIRRQLKAADQHVKTAKDQTEALARFAAAAESRTESAKQSAHAAESQAESAMKIRESVERIEKMMEHYFLGQKK